ncbi:hypothetical protein DdX_19818 [Ditylenchus destructor]|uniref:Uncharacterized protein n=1 Tax=Ditylenchus destructor TaxID=166010 RepID=A0AAD4MMI1_9BILA|nr:hypothetical protein DdX_19818 [Ditylenchus destructor]
MLKNLFKNQDPAVIRMFNEELSPEDYNKFIARNGYSKQIPLEGQIAGKEVAKNDRGIYEFVADAYQNPNCRYIAATVLHAHVELNDNNWPLFQHFIRLLMDPFIYIGYLELNPQMELLNLLTEAMNPDRNRLQCKHLNIRFNDDTQKFIVWIKDHVRCDEFQIYLDSDSNYDEELLDFFMTGAHCTSAIYTIQYDLSKVLVDLVQKFTGLKSRDEYQMVESIRGNVEDREVVDELKRTFAEFISKEFEKDQIIVFINNDIEKKLTLNVYNYTAIPFLSIKITNL